MTGPGNSQQEPLGRSVEGGAAFGTPLDALLAHLEGLSPASLTPELRELIQKAREDLLRQARHGEVTERLLGDVGIALANAGLPPASPPPQDPPKST